MVRSGLKNKNKNKLDIVKVKEKKGLKPASPGAR